MVSCWEQQLVRVSIAVGWGGFGWVGWIVVGVRVKRGCYGQAWSVSSWIGLDKVVVELELYQFLFVNLVVRRSCPATTWSGKCTSSSEGVGAVFTM